jgi:hypothetical protein
VAEHNGNRRKLRAKKVTYEIDSRYSEFESHIIDHNYIYKGEEEYDEKEGKSNKLKMRKNK